MVSYDDLCFAIVVLMACVFALILIIRDMNSEIKARNQMEDGYKHEISSLLHTILLKIEEKDGKRE